MKKIIKTFKVKINVSPVCNNEVTYSFEMEYSNTQEFQNIVQHARMLWDDCMIEAETELFTQSFSHTYKQEVMLGLAK